jgi:annexin A10
VHHGQNSKSLHTKGAFFRETIVFPVTKIFFAVFPTKFLLSIEDAPRLKKATKSSRTGKETIIQVLTNRCNSQRLEIKSQFEKLFTDDLLEQLKKHLCVDFRHLIEALLPLLPQPYAQELNRAVKGLGTYD